MFVLEAYDPVDGRITSDNFVGPVNHDTFIVLGGGILGYPIAVEQCEGREGTATFALCHTLMITLGLKVVYTM